MTKSHDWLAQPTPTDASQSTFLTGESIYKLYI